MAGNYVKKITEMINEIVNGQMDKIRESAELMANTIIGGGCVWAFGATHSSIMVQEMVYRAGGLVPINPLFAPGLDVSVRPVTLSSKLERLPDYGKILVYENNVRASDCVVIFSTSGRNAVPIDVALAAKEIGATAIGIVSYRYANAVPSRHPSGKSLHELDLDVLIDNGAPEGDALIEVQGQQDAIRVGPASTVTSCVLINAIVVETAIRLANQLDHIPIFVSGNLENGDKHNKEMLKIYKDRLAYM